MRAFGTLLLALGVALSAAAGIQLGSGEYLTKVADGRAVLAASAQAPETTPPATAAVRLDDWFREAGVQFVAGLALLLVGAVMGRVAISRDGVAETAADGHDFGASLQQLVSGIEETRLSLSSATDSETQTRIERLAQEQVLPMIEARYALQRQFGLAGFATVLGPVSGGERLLNRAWSTLVDGHRQACADSLTDAQTEFQTAREALQELENAHEQPT